MTRDVIRREGFYDGVDEVLMDKLIGKNLTRDESEEFAETLIDYIHSEGKDISKENRLVGTTEALKGLFGDYKTHGRRKQNEFKWIRKTDFMYEQ